MSAMVTRSFRMEPELDARLKEAADKFVVGMNLLITTAIREYLDAYPSGFAPCEEGKQ